MKVYPDKLIDHIFPLREGSLAVLSLPRNLTPAEAERCGVFIKTLIRPEPTKDQTCDA